MILMAEIPTGDLQVSAEWYSATFQFALWFYATPRENRFPLFLELLQ